MKLEFRVAMALWNRRKGDKSVLNAKRNRIWIIRKRSLLAQSPTIGFSTPSDWLKNHLSVYLVHNYLTFLTLKDNLLGGCGTLVCAVFWEWLQSHVGYHTPHFRINDYSAQSGQILSQSQRCPVSITIVSIHILYFIKLTYKGDYIFAWNLNIPS